jgi:hypothetical protein
MKKGQKLKCISSNVGYITNGYVYSISAGMGDVSSALGAYGFKIKDAHAFTISDDEGDCIFQAGMSGAHGDFEVIE